MPSLIGACWRATSLTLTLVVACTGSDAERLDDSTNASAGATAGTEAGADDQTDDELSASAGNSMPSDGSAGDDDPGDEDPGDEDPGDEAPGDDDTGALPPSCGGVAPAPGVQSALSIEVDGVTRHYDLFIPSTYDANVPAPLVLNFHGLLGSPAQQSALSQFNVAAQGHGMIVAYPAGVGASFNGGTCCGTASSTGVDDVGFSRALVSHLVDALCIAEDRVYATGMSNGGHMAHLLACEAADVFAAVASVTGVLTIPPGSCAPSRPISVLDFHGDADPIVPFGGTGIGFPAVPMMMSDWAARNGCQGSSTVSFEQGDMRCETWPQCDAGVEVSLCITAGGGHCWPGANSCLFGSVSDELSASEAIAALFASQSR